MTVGQKSRRMLALCSLYGSPFGQLLEMTPKESNPAVKTGRSSPLSILYQNDNKFRQRGVT